jgi:hypothetical protein
MPSTRASTQELTGGWARQDWVQMPYGTTDSGSYGHREEPKEWIMTMTRKAAPTLDAGAGAARISLRLLWWAPLSIIVGFVFANRFLSETWPLWQVLPLAVTLATPFGIGAFYGLRAARLGTGRGWLTFAVHLMLMLMALTMPISEALS